MPPTAWMGSECVDSRKAEMLCAYVHVVSYGCAHRLNDDIQAASPSSQGTQCIISSITYTRVLMGYQGPCRRLANPPLVLTL
jgi:hypothetical protein